MQDTMGVAIALHLSPFPTKAPNKEAAADEGWILSWVLVVCHRCFPSVMGLNNILMVGYLIEEVVWH